MHKLFIIILLLTTQQMLAQTEITWETLGDVKFTDTYMEEVEANYYYPTFGASVKALENKEVYLKGYLLAIDPSDNFYVLSRQPFASCYFCGSGGPESVAEIVLKPGVGAKLAMNEVVTIKGTLKLNHDDVNRCNYILEEAKVYENQ